jgi:hypothetical protein
VLILIAGCEKPTEPDTEIGDEVGMTNPNPPTANHLIVSESVFGDPAKKSSIWDMDGNQTDGFFFEGLDDFVYCAGSMTGTGTPVWRNAIAFGPRDVMNIQTDRFTGSLIVGGYDSDEDGTKDQGIVSLINPNGTSQYELVVAYPSMAIWFNAAVAVSDSIYLCVGGSQILDTFYPLLHVVHLAPDTTLSAGSMAIVAELPNNYFNDVELGIISVEDETGRIAVDCYISGFKETNEMENITLHAFRCPIDSLENRENFWSRDIIAYPGLNTSTSTGDNLTLVNSTLYIAGKTQANKHPEPISGGYWSGGLIASVSTAGNINWIHPVLLSQYSDYYYTLYATSNALYAVGKYSSFWNGTTDRLFGYGLLSRFDLATGDAVHHLSFGNEKYSSGFNTLNVEGLTAAAGGWTHGDTNGGVYQSWFVQIDLSSAVPTSIVLEKKNSAGMLDGHDDCTQKRGGRSSGGVGRSDFAE